MAYEQRARISPSQPDNFIDSTKKNLNPWQDNSTNNYLGGYHGNAVYQEPPVSPQLDPMLQESLWGNFPDVRHFQRKERKYTQEHKVTDDGWSEWPEDWGVEDSDECMSNGFSNGFNNPSSYSQQNQITTSQPQPQDFGQFWSTPNQQQITQSHKVESAPPNSFFDNAQLNNSTASTPGSTAHFFQQESMAAESANVRTGISYAAVLSGKPEAPEQNNGEFDDISLNDNTDAGFNEEATFKQPEPALPAASFSPFPAPMPEKMERSAAHLFSHPAARSENKCATVSGSSHNDPFGSAAEPSLEIDNAFGEERTFAQEQQQRDDIGHPGVQEPIGISHPTPATEELRLTEMPAKESEEANDKAFEVHRAPPNEIVPPNIEDSFASNQPFSYPTLEQRQPELPLQQSEEAADNAFEVQKQPSNTSVPQSIEDSFASNQPFSYPTQEPRESELPLQQTEKAADNAFEVQGQPPNKFVPESIEDSFASNQPFSFPTQEQKPPELPQTEKATDNTFGGVHSVRSEESVNPNVVDSFASHQPFSFPTQEQRQPETALQESEEATNIHEDLQPERSQESFFASGTPSRIADSFGIDEGMGQTVEQPNQVVPGIEESFAVNQPAIDMEDQRPPEEYLQQPESGDNIQDQFGVGSSSHGEHNEPTVPRDDLNQMAWGLDGSSMTAPENSLQDSQQDHMAQRDTTPQVPWQQISATQATPFGEPSAMVTGTAPSIPMPEDSPDTSESDSSSSSTHDTSSNSDQSQIETAAWREEEVPSYDKYNQPPPPPTYMPQSSPRTMGKMEDDVPRAEIYEQKQSTPATNVLPPPSMMPGNIVADGPRQVASELFQPAAPPPNIANVPGNDFFQHEQSAPPSDAIHPPPMAVGKMEGDVPKSGSHEFFQPGPNMVQPLPVGKVEEDVLKASAQTYFQPGPPPTHMMQPPPMTGSKAEENDPKTGGQTYFQPGPHPTHMMQPPPMTGSKTEENDPKTGGQTYFQPGPHPTHMMQPPPMTGSKTEENAPKIGGQTYFQPSLPPTHMVQPPPMTGSKAEEVVPKTGGQTYFQPDPPPTHMMQPPPMTGSKTEENAPKTGAQTYFQPGPPPTHMMQPPPMTGSKAEEVVPKTGGQTYFQPDPPPTHMMQPPPMTGSKTEENAPKTGAQTYFQPGPPPTHMMQSPPLTGSKAEEVVPKTGAKKYFQPSLPPIHKVQSSHVAADEREDVPKRGGHEYFQPGQPPPSNQQPPPSNRQPHPTVAGKMETKIPNQFNMQDQSAPPSSTMPPPSVGNGLKKPLHEHSQPTPPVSTAPPVPMFSKASHTEHNAKPSKTSTPEPLMPPESGPMAMTKRATSKEKSRTPVCMSSSLWSTNVPTAISPAIMLAPALQSPKPAVPSPASSEALQPKQELSGSQELLSDQGLETKGDSSATLSKKERKAEKKRLKALKKEQKKLNQESNVENPSTNMTVPATSTSEQTQSSLHQVPVVHDLSTENPVGNPHVMQESGHHTSQREYHHEKHTRGDKYGVQHEEVGNPHVGDHGTTEESVHYPTRETEYHGKSEGHGIGNPHRGEHRSRYAEDHAEERKHSRHRNVEDESQYNYSNPRVRELREESPSRVSQRQSEHLSYQDYTHKHDDRDSHREHYSGSHVLRTSREDFQDRSLRGNEHYDDFRHNTSREYDDHHGPHEYDDRVERDYRYTRERREAEGYRNNDYYDHYKRGQPKADNYDYYSSRRSREDHSYLDRSFDSQYDHGRPERSSREELDSYRNDYHKDSADRDNFKPITDTHYGEYKEPYSSSSPSSGSGRSTPAGYSYSHDPYYGYQQQQPHHYPGYEQQYGYYPGPYGMPYHYPPPSYYPGYGPYYDYYHQYAAFGSGHGSQYSSGEGSYPENQVNEEQQAEESALEKDQEEGEVQEVVPLRTTPLHFLRPHMTCRFGPAGQLLVTLPHHPDDGQKPLVQVSCLKAVFSIKEKEQIEAFPGPLSCRGTMKRQVIEYVQTKADEIHQSSTNLASQQARWVLWKFLLSLIKHNGAIVAEDIAEMLMMSVQHFEKKKKTKKTKKKRQQSEESSSSDSSSDDDSSDDSSSDSSDDEESSEEDAAAKPVDHLLVFRGLLLEGKTKEALEYGMSNGLWAHAVLLGGLMDTKVNNSMLDSKNSSSIISRFFMTLEEKDPLKTVYEHLGGKVPHAVKHHTNWASNLAGIIANPTSFPDKDKENIITLGDTLAKQPDLLLASHLCYLLAGLRPGTPGTNSKMVLIGCKHRSKKCDKFESLEALQLTELFEYASSLENSEFFLPGLQVFRYFYATKLVDAGYHKEALDYLQFVGDLMMKHPHSFNETMKKNVYKTTEQLVGYMEQSGTNVELFVQSWLKKFNNVMEGKDSGISLPQQESEIDDDEDPMAQSSMSYFSGYEHQTTHDEKTSPESTPYTHNTVSRQASIQSTHSVPSVHSLQNLDLSQQVTSDIYQPNEPIEHKESFSSQSYQDQNDGPVGQEYQMRQRTESFDSWQQQQQSFGNNMWMPGGVQQNSWMQPATTEEIGRGTSPEDGETTPVNASQSFEDYYNQANPITGTGGNWEDNSATPTLSPSDSSLPSKDMSESHEKEEKNNSKAAESKPAQSSGFWTGITGLVKTFIPKVGPKEVFLPEDKNKTIYFDKELNKWINTEEKDEDKAPPPPPPTDAMMGGMSGPPPLGPRPGGNPMTGAPQGMMPPNHPTMPIPGSMNTQAESVPDNSRGGPGSPGGPGFTGNNQQPLPGMLPGMQNGKPAGPPSKFSRKAQGRLGSRNKYVDVLNPNKGSQSSSNAVPPALFPVMPTGGGSFQGTLFVPSAAPADNDADNSLSQPPTDIQSGQDNPQPPSPTHSRSSSLGSQSTVSLASAEVRSYFEGQEQEGEQLQNATPYQPTFFDPTNFQPQQQSPSMARRGRGRYPGGYNK